MGYGAMAVLAATRRAPNGGSRLVGALEAAYGDVRARVAELPDVVMVTGSGLSGYGLRWGHFAHDRWVEALAEGRRPELFVGGERLACGAELVMQTLLHECAHALAAVRGVKDTSRGFRYHNQRFLALARELGLDYLGDAPHGSIGWSAVELTDAAREEYASTISALGAAIDLWLDNPLDGLTIAPPGGSGGLPGGSGGVGLPGGDGGRVRRTGGPRSHNLLRAVCDCVPPRIVRVAPATLAAGPVTCGLCDGEFLA